MIEIGGQCKACAQLESLNNQISDATKHLERLMKKRDDFVLTEVNARHDPFSSILPREISSLVFEHYVAEGWPVFTLGWVCRAWREIALTTPLLWTEIHITLKHHNPIADLEFLKAHIRHSGQLPLSISLCDEDRQAGNAAPSAIDETLIDTVNECSDRWECLDLELHPSLLELFRGRNCAPFGAPMLKKLVLSPIFSGTEDSDRARFGVGQLKPRPSEVVFSDTPPKNIDIDWSDVALVDMGGIYLYEAFDLLLLAPHMITCDLAIATLPSPITDSTLPDTLQHRLQNLYLRLGCENWAEILPFFTNLTLPNLEHLEIEGGESAQDLPNTALVSLLNRSSCPLASLDLNKVYLTANDLEMILTAAPSLKKLFVGPCLPDGCPELDPLFGLLAKTVDDAGQRFLPLLESIVITGFITSWDPVVDFCLQASSPGGRPLTDVEVKSRISISVSERPPPRSSINLSTLPTILEDLGISMAVRLREIAVHDSYEHSMDLVYIKVNA
ncbi:hypothetical protein CVT26_000167 [Gymnopilus dilepis]|uniref:Uncharacterized protein n=1 Tax=Gymnopilus dilepis TaxID=231916 RepID=A0A409WW64_9AGAR|nr:hypothetical protein CVT26_000167 [Gymnopilus dilepis]